MKKQFTEERMKAGKEITDEQAVRMVLGNHGLLVFENDPSYYPDDQLFGALFCSIDKLQENSIPLHINSLVHAAVSFGSDYRWTFRASIFAEAVTPLDSEGAAILAYFNFLYTEDREDLWFDCVTDKDCFKGIPILAEIVEWVLVESIVNGGTPPEYVETVKQGKSLNPDGFSGDERISKDALTAIILLGNFPKSEGMLEAGLWSIQRQELREIVCTIIAYSRDVFPDNLQNVAKQILKELNPEFIEYVEFVEETRKNESGIHSAPSTPSLPPASPFWLASSSLI